jgi:two-component system, LytTR family, sensor kinase
MVSVELQNSPLNGKKSFQRSILQLTDFCFGDSGSWRTLLPKINRMASSIWQKKIIGGVELGWVATVVAFYIVFYLVYAFTLVLNEMAYSERSFTELLYYYGRNQAIDYFIKFLLTIPLCYLYFRWLKKGHLPMKVALHIVTMILFVLVWKHLFYWTMESIGSGHLRGSSQVWDIYIPALFYVIQFGFFHAFEYYYQLKEQKDIESQLRQASLKNELAALKAQLNPHFLYNVFNTISASVPPEQERTRELIAELADLFRYQLKASRAELVPLRDEIEFIEKYLDLEKARFGERLKTQIDIADNVLDEKVPSMMLQPLVENSLKHGLASLIEGGEVAIKIHKEGDWIHFKISDTGIGMKNKTQLGLTEGIGLQNTQLRLEKLYDSTLQFSDNHPRGLTIRFTIKSLKAA